MLKSVAFVAGMKFRMNVYLLKTIKFISLNLIKYRSQIITFCFIYILDRDPTFVVSELYITHDCATELS